MLAAVSLAADPSTLTWEKLAPTRSVLLRASFASAYDPISKKVVIFGGFNASNSLNETRTFDGTTWVQVKTSVAPSVRTAASMAYQQKIQKLVLFGGASGFTVLGDTWLWDGATSTWTQANPKTVPAAFAAKHPSIREGLGTLCDPTNHQFLIFGGNVFTRPSSTATPGR